MKPSYSETLEILYRENIFHFRGGLGLPAFKSSIPSLQWNAIRYIHISTAYSPFYDANLFFTGYNAPKMLPNWRNICEYLAELPNLHDLRFDILADDPNTGHLFKQNSDKILLSILQPLKRVRADTIEVELNVQVPEKIWEILKPVNLTAKYYERPFNEKVFSTLSMHDAMDLEMPDKNSRYI